MPRLSWLVGVVRSKIGCQTGGLGKRFVWASSALAIAAFLLPAGALAATCTDTWTGPAEGSWSTAEDWSLSAVPTASEVACIGPKTKVNVIGSDAVGVIQVEGTLSIAGGTLELTNGSEPSSVASLSIIAAGTLQGAGTIDVTNSLSVGNGVMLGTGETIVQSGASAAVTGGDFLDLEGRRLVNEGIVSVEEGDINATSGTEIINSGTFKASSQSVAIGGSGTLVNTGVIEKATGSGRTEIQVDLKNQGTLKATSGSFRLISASTWSSGSVLEGTIEVTGRASNITGDDFLAQNATIELIEATLTVPKPDNALIGDLVMRGGVVTGAGTVEISKFFTATLGAMEGAGLTILRHGATASFGSSTIFEFIERQFLNEGVMTFDKEGGLLYFANNAELINLNTFKASAESHGGEEAAIRIREGNAFIQNYGLFEKNEGSHTTWIEPTFESLGAVVAYSGGFRFNNPVRELTPTQFAERSPSAPHQPRSNCGDPVNCATGNFYQTQTDLSVGGRGVGLNLTRTYNSQAAAEGTTGNFGHGWSSSFSDHIAVEAEVATVYHGNGSTVSFTQTKGGGFVSPSWTQDKLAGNSTAGYSLVLANQVKYQFEGSTGRLQSVTDRNGNQTTLAYNKASQLETITDPAGRKITLTYNGEGLVESAKDPLGHTAKYAYEEGSLTSVTLPGETKARWQYHYGEAHQMTSMTDGRGGTTTNEYDSSHRVTSQTDPAGHKLKFEYASFHTVITNNGTGSVTSEWFNSYGEPTYVTRGFGTSSAVTETLLYNTAGYLIGKTDGNEHTTNWTYDAAGDMTSETTPDQAQTKWTYNGTHDALTVTSPKGETTTIARDSHGNAETISRPLSGTTQTTTYHYNTNGKLTSVVDPLKHTWSYEYDPEGDRTSETDPEGDKRTSGYNEDSQVTSVVSPNGNVKGAESAQYTTKTERDTQGRPVKITDPLGHTTKYTYDGNGNLETVTDANGNTTTYDHNGDNQIEAVKSPNGNVAETEYDGAGRVVAEIDGNKHKTTYVRNVLGEVVEVKDPLGRVTSKEYDAAGNLTKVIDAASRKTTYTYDPANHLIEVSYSDGKTPTVKYEYDADGSRTKMTDGTGTTTYVYDALDRLIKSADGHSEGVEYEYDLAGNQTKLTYPNGQLLTRAYDSADRLQSVTDWSKNTTTFAYNPDSDLVSTTFPKASGLQDKVFYNQADQVMKITMVNGVKIYASLAYSRNNLGQIKATIATGLPGGENTSYSYDTKSRLTSAGGTSYEYDAGDNPTTLGASSSTYDAANQLKTSGSAVYGYDQLGERTSATTKTGLTTIYSYDQAGDLTQVKQSKLNGLNVTYSYDGDGMRASQTKGKTTTHLTWDVRGGLPLILSDEQTSYIYGPEGLPIEQVPSKGSILYLHHDQQGSTRVLSATSGATEATMTYDAYGNLTGATGTGTTPLGYDGQYTNADTGLIYMRLRTYDPATAQFLTVDPIAAITRARYSYAFDNPLYFADPTGLGFFSEVAEYAGAAALVPGVDVVAGPVAIISGGIATVQDAANGEYLNAAADATGVVIGYDGSLEKDAAEASDDSAQELLRNPETEEGPRIEEVETIQELHEVREAELELGGAGLGFFPPEDPRVIHLPIPQEVLC